MPLHEEGALAARTPFPGKPRTYLRLAVLGSIAIHAYLFIGYWVIKVFVAGETWPVSWVPVAATIASAAVMARVAYRWIMRIDAQFGRGSGWSLESTTLKLPREQARGRKRTAS